MDKQTFWYNARKEYLAKLFSNLTLLTLGALGSSEIFKLGVGIKLTIGVIALLSGTIGVLAQPNNPSEEE